MHSLSRFSRLLAAAGLVTASAATSAEVQIRAAGTDSTLPDELRDNLRAHLPLASEPCDAPTWRIRRRLKRAPETLDPALRAFGYYAGRIETELKQTDDCWLAEIRVDPGTPVTVHGVKIEVEGEGRGSEPFKRIVDEPAIQPGEVLRHDRYEAIKTALRNTALEYGYFDAEFKQHELRVDPQAQQADIRIRFDTGARYRVGALRFSKQPLNEDFVRRLGGLKSDTPYAARDLAALDRNLTDSGYFSRVDVLPQREQTVDRAIPVDVEISPKARHAWRFGIGFETDVGPRLSLGYDNRYINRRGHQFGAEMHLSPVISELTGKYTIPGEEPHKETFALSGGIKYEDTDGTRSDSIEIGGQQILRRHGWTKVRYVKLLHERSEIGDQTTNATLLMPGISWDRIHSDDPLRTEHGYRLHFEISGAHDALLSTATLLRLESSAKGIHRFSGAGRITGRIDLGATLTDDFNDLPSSLRFYAGGDNSVRGYGYKRLSPRDSNNDPIGGRYLLAGSFEYEHPVSADENWWAAAFVDAGNAFDTEDFELKVGYGVGLRWYSPIGRVRLDIALPQDNSEDDYRLHFGMGVDL
jgi:translocation and assembly module TamA